MNHNVLILAGDGIGPEIMAQAEKVLATLVRGYGLDISVEHALVGGAAYDDCGTPLPGQTLQLALASDAVLFGSVGGPKWMGWRVIYGLSAVRCCPCVRNLPCLPT